MKKIHLHTLLALVGTSAPASATTLFGLTATNSLIRFDSATPNNVTVIGTVPVAGIVDIDFHPANGEIYGMTANGTTYSINMIGAGTTLRVTPLTALSGISQFDFNPSADRLRLFGSGNSNFRMVPDFITPPSAAGTAGTVINDGNLASPTLQPVSNAYSNNVDGTATTTLFSIDAATDSLFVHSVGPAFNTVTSVGPLGILVDSAFESVGFDIGQDGVAYLSNGDNIYTVNLTTGNATLLGNVGQRGLKTITAIPEPATGLIALAGTALLTIRRRRA